MQGYSSSVPSIAFVQVLLSDFQSDEPKHQKVQLAMAPVDLYQDELIYTLTAPSIDPSSREAENVKIRSKNPKIQACNGIFKLLICANPEKSTVTVLGVGKIFYTKKAGQNKPQQSVPSYWRCQRSWAKVPLPSAVTELKVLTLKQLQRAPIPQPK